MSESNNKAALAWLLILWVILVGAAYARVTSFRGFLDDKAPWFKERVGHYLVSSETRAADGAASDGENPEAPAPALTLDTLAANQALWPKILVLKTSADFPAVVNNKAVGTVRAPAGSQVHLMQIRNGKLGLEFQGGGAWVTPENTDLGERVRLAVAAPKL